MNWDRYLHKEKQQISVLFQNYDKIILHIYDKNITFNNVFNSFQHNVEYIYVDNLTNKINQQLFNT